MQYSNGIEIKEKVTQNIMITITFILLLPIFTSITTSILPNHIHYQCMKLNQYITKIIPLCTCIILYHLHFQQDAEEEDVNHCDSSIVSKIMLMLVPKTYNNKNLVRIIHYIQDVICITCIYNIYQHLCAVIQFNIIKTDNTNISRKKQIINTVGGYIMNHVKYIPIVSNIVSSEYEKIEQSISDLFNDQKIQSKKNYKLPKIGINDDTLLSEMKSLVEKENNKWKDGYCSGSVYHGGDEHINVLNEASSLYSVSNPLHLDIWPSLRKYEAEIVSMTANLLNGNGANNDVCGTMTSGGTESIVLATKSHRDWYYKEKGIKYPEIIAGVTAHAAIDKACDLLNIKLIKVPVDPKSYKINVDILKRYITCNTIMIYASAPNFPQGVIDDVESLSKIALDYDVGLHVDCCLGGFVLPFAKDLGYGIPTFDFALDGVTSMSCDTHKYGYATKGTSIVLYRNKNIRQYQYFTFPEWTGGLYVTPTIAGSRPGALSAACWAAMMRLGYEGYMKRTNEILQTTQLIKRGIQEQMSDHLFVLGDPIAMIVCFTSKELNIFDIGDILTKKFGWNLNSLQYPSCIHICVTLLHIGKADIFLNDLKSAVDVVAKRKKEEGGSKRESGGNSALYGMATTLPAGPVEDILKIYTDYSLKV